MKIKVLIFVIFSSNNIDFNFLIKINIILLDKNNRFN